MKKNKTAISLIGVLTAEVMILFLLSIIWTGKSNALESRIALETTAVSETPATVSRTVKLAETIIPENRASGPPDYDRKKLHNIYKACKKSLILVNIKHALKDDYKAALTPICHGRLYASKGLQNSLNQMLSDASQEGYQFWIASAYRSRKKQQRLVEEDIRKGMGRGLSYEEAVLDTYRETMPPGHSEHETGLALDILCSGNMRMDTSQKSEPGNKWLRRNCHKYGFILRYPKDKEDITGINYEPWHFRYVGKRAAAYMREEHITLEEFWDRLE